MQSLPSVLEQRKVEIPVESFHHDNISFNTENIGSKETIHQSFGLRSVGQVFNQQAIHNLCQPFAPGQNGEGRGSGFMHNGFMITNNHVIDQGVNIRVSFPAYGKEKFKASVYATSPESDIAMLKIDIDPEKVKNLEFADSDHLQSAAAAFACGFPLGMEGQKITSGVISGYETLGSQVLIQTDVSLNPGNSGGPLLDASGAVVGINSSIIQGKNGVGYAIPSQKIKTFIQNIKIQEGLGKTTPFFISRPVLGAFCQKSNKNQTKLLKNPEEGGYYVNYVLPGSLLGNGGLQKGDQIHQIGGHKVDMFGQTHVDWSETPVSLWRIFDRCSYGDKVTISVFREGKSVELDLKYNECDPRAVGPKFFPYQTIEYEAFAGMVVQQLSQNHLPILMRLNPLLSRYLLPSNLLVPAVIVTHVFPGSDIQQQKLINIGNIIRFINGVSIQTIADFRTFFKTHGNDSMFTFETDFNNVCVVDKQSIIEDPSYQMFKVAPSSLLTSLTQETKISQVSNILSVQDNLCSTCNLLECICCKECGLLECGCGCKCCGPGNCTCGPDCHCACDDCEGCKLQRLPTQQEVQPIVKQENKDLFPIGTKVEFKNQREGKYVGIGTIVKRYPSGKTVKIQSNGSFLKRRLYHLRIPFNEELLLSKVLLDQGMSSEEEVEEEEVEEEKELILSLDELQLYKQQLGCTHLSDEIFLDQYKYLL